MSSSECTTRGPYRGISKNERDQTTSDDGCLPQRSSGGQITIVLAIVLIAYDAYAPRIFLAGGSIAASGGFMSIAVAIGMSCGAPGRPRMARRATVGDAAEVRAAGPSAPMVWCSAGSGAAIFATMGPNMCCVRTDAQRQGCRPGGADIADLAGERDRSRHQGENWEITGGLRARFPAPPAAAG
jgi:hypothetical protein